MLKNYSKNKDEFSYSTTPRLPINTNDISYDNYPKIIEQINKSQIIFSLNKTKSFKFKSENEIYNEFKILKNFIDNDKIHYNNLIEENDIKNRYSDIRTYVYNTVPLSSNNYINASFINFPKKNFFIATQAPLNNTIEDFYQMIFDYDINIIVMLCSCYENGKLKCIEYYDSDLNEKLKKFYIEIIDEKKINNFNLKYREIKIVDKINNKNKIIKQIQILGWKDHNIIDLNKYYESFIYLIKFILQNNNNAPVLTHCSAGVGRTGTFISLFCIYFEIFKQLNEKKNEIKFSIFNLVRKIKELRIFLVENEIQYKFIYNFIDKVLQNVLNDFKENKNFLNSEFI